MCTPDWLAYDKSRPRLVETLSDGSGAAEQKGAGYLPFPLASVTFSSGEAVSSDATSLHHLVLGRVVDAKVGKNITSFVFFLIIFFQQPLSSITVFCFLYNIYTST